MKSRTETTLDMVLKTVRVSCRPNEVMRGVSDGIRKAYFLTADFQSYSMKLT